MKIASRIPNEPAGRTITLGEQTYHFAPDANGVNVCEVTDKAHIGRLLSIVEGYELYDGTKPAPLPQATTGRPASSDDPFARPVTEMTDGEPVPSDEEVERSAKAEREGPNYNGMTRKQLVAAFEKKFGKPPHPAAKDATILAKLVG